MKPVHISQWHMKVLVQELNALLDSSFSVVPMLNNAGVKVFSQWHTCQARFWFQTNSTVLVTLEPEWGEVNRSALITAVVRAFHWDHVPAGSRWCCGLLPWRSSKQLLFAL